MQEEDYQVKWAKVTFGSKLKRIAMPALELEAFVQQVRAHFASDDLGNFQTKGVSKGTFGLKWLQASNLQESCMLRSQNAIQVRDTDHFQEILKIHAFNQDERGKVPRFEIIQEATNENLRVEQISAFLADENSSYEEPLALSLEPDQKVFESPIPLKLNQDAQESTSSDEETRSDLESLHIARLTRNYLRKHLEILGPKVFKEIMESCDEDWLDKLINQEEVVDLDDAIRQQLNSLEQLPLAKIDVIPDVNQVRENQPRLQMIHSNYNLALAEEQFEEIKEDSVVSLRIHASLECQALKNSNIFKKVYNQIVENIFDQEPIVQLGKNQENEVYCELQKTNLSTQKIFDVTWLLTNPKTTPWPADLRLIPIMSSPSMRMFFDSQIQPLGPGLSSHLKVGITVPTSFTSDYFVVLFKIRKANRQFLGPSLVLCVSIRQNEQKEDLKSSFEEEKEESICEFSDEQYLSMGSILVDEGYGSFERCCMIIRTVKGVMVAAKDVLSKLMITEAQLKQ